MIQLPICNIGNSLDPVWNTCVNLIGPSDTLPIPDHIDNICLDLETTSERPHVASTNPHAESVDETGANLHRDCKICGVSILFDDERVPYYIPVRHAYLDDNDEYCYRTHDCANVNPEKVYDWLRIVMKKAKWWSNHNIKYDVHVLLNEMGQLKLPKLRDTLSLAKLSDFEEQFEYGLTTVMRLLGIDITPYEDCIDQYLNYKIDRKKIKDYGLIPPDKMAVYAAVDVLCIRYLLEHLNIHRDCQRVVQMEMDLLPELIRMEQIGLRLNIPKLKHDWDHIAKRQNKRITAIKRVTGFTTFQPDKKESLKLFFHDHLGWNLNFTETSIKNMEKGLITEEQATFSFGYDSIIKHFKDKPHVAAIWLKYQEEQKLLTSFTIPYLETHATGEELIHFSFNQIVRTGRMSCTQPNMQQLPIEAKEYILPYDDSYALVEFDLSQIEFRVIVHYINNRRAIEQFNRDPSTDFHTWVAEMCRIKRKPAKTCNFLCGYGGGKDKLVAELSGLKEIRQELSSEDEIRSRAYGVYKAYHEGLPELKRTAYHAGDVLRARGYVRTLLGRHRYLPRKMHFKSFNSICQGSAADIQKDITLRLRKFFSVDCLPQCLVHDSWLFSIRKTRLAELIPEIKYEIEKPIEGVQFSVPLLSDYGVSEKNWRLCDG